MNAVQGTVDRHPDGLDALIEATQPFGGSVAVGPDMSIGLSLATDASDFWDAMKIC